MTTPTAADTATPLDRPLYHASPGQAFVRFWKKYATFAGRASRSEYWWIVLVSLTVGVAFYAIELGAAGWDPAVADTTLNRGDILNSVWFLATALPTLAVTVRRLHDINRSGWWILVGLIPVVGWIIHIVWTATASDPAGTRFDGYKA